MPLSCRLYANEFPKVNDTVMVRVKKIAEMGAYVTLKEYNNKEGMILLPELSPRRISPSVRAVNKLIRAGTSECVVVIRVDTRKGYVDLSKRRVCSKDLLQCEERFARAKAIYSILRHVAELLGYETNEQLEELYNKTAWHFDRKAKEKAAAFATFKKALTDRTVFDECDISDDVKAKLIEVIQKKLGPQALKIRAYIKVSCHAYEGVEAIKTALTEGKKCSTEETSIKILLFASPVFVVNAQATDRVEGIDAVNKTLDVIKKSIKSFGGTRKIIMAPAVVTDIDGNEIKKRLELMNLENESDADQEDERLRAPKGCAGGPEDSKW
ncbi:eukaryotic translation initiation factor 2 subunit 1 [Aphelenchoides avenae]|nr:eukaryotic translation initiation factor 2 subunit 1 [Aphelenchus avenae]